MEQFPVGACVTDGPDGFVAVELEKARDMVNEIAQWD